MEAVRYIKYKSVFNLPHTLSIWEIQYKFILLHTKAAPIEQPILQHLMSRIVSDINLPKGGPFCNKILISLTFTLSIEYVRYNPQCIFLGILFTKEPDKPLFCFFLRNRHVNQIHFSAETSNGITKIRI